MLVPKLAESCTPAYPPHDHEEAPWGGQVTASVSPSSEYPHALDFVVNPAGHPIYFSSCANYYFYMRFWTKRPQDTDFILVQGGGVALSLTPGGDHYRFNGCYYPKGTIIKYEVNYSAGGKEFEGQHVWSGPQPDPVNVNKSFSDGEILKLNNAYYEFSAEGTGSLGEEISSFLWTFTWQTADGPVSETTTWTKKPLGVAIGEGATEPYFDVTVKALLYCEPDFYEETSRIYVANSSTPNPFLVNPTHSCGANPVKLGSGQKVESITEFEVPYKGGGNYVFRRHYDSSTGGGDLGQGWISSLSTSYVEHALGPAAAYRDPDVGGNIHLEFPDEVVGESTIPPQSPMPFYDSIIEVRLPNGGQVGFYRVEDNFFPMVQNHFYTMEEDEEGLHLVYPDKRHLVFGADGNLVKEIDKNGWETHYTWSTGAQGERVLTITLPGAQSGTASKTSPDGRVVEVHYRGTSAYIDTISLKEGALASPYQTYAYLFDSDNRLTTITGKQEGSTFYTASYQYEGSSGRMTRKNDPKSDYYKVLDIVWDQTTYKVDSEWVAGSRRFKFTYDTLNNKTTITDGNNNDTVYHLGAYDRVNQKDLPDGTVITYEYDNVQRVTKVTTDPLLGDTLEETYTYDYYGNRLNKTTTQAGKTRTESWTYGDVSCGCGNMADTYTDPRGKVTDYDYDAAGNLFSVTEPQNEDTGNYPETEFVRVAGTGEIDYVEDAKNNRTYLVYDGLGNLSTATLPGSAGYFQFWYDAIGRVTKVRRPDGYFTHYTLNGYGDPILVSYRDKSDVEKSRRVLEYWDHGAIKTVYAEDTGTGMVEQSFIYDSYLQLESMTDRGVTTTYTYDGSGNRKDVSRAGETWTTTYDNRNRPDIRTDPANKTMDYDFDAFGRMTKFTDRNGKVTSWSHDGLSQIVTMTDANLDDTRYEFDSAGNLIKLMQAYGTGDQKTLQYVYNNRGLVKEEIDDEGTWVKQYEYDDNGNLDLLKQRNGKNLDYSYDAVNRVTSESWGADGYTYVWGDGGDGKGWHLYTATRGSRVDTYTYDHRDRILTHSKPEGEVLTYVYDPDGQPKSTTLSFRSTMGLPDYVQSWTYDSLRRPDGVSGSGFADKDIDFDFRNRLDKETLASGVVSKYSYDDDNDFLKSIKHSAPQGGLLEKVEYGLDFEGNRTSRTTLLGQRSFTYDNIYQLDVVTTEAGQAGFSATTEDDTVTGINFDYDKAGNRDDVTTSYTGLSDLVEDYTAGGSNELILAAGQSQTFDGNGNLISRGTRSFTWDSRNRLIGVSDSGLSWSADYDSNDRIYKRQVGSLRYDMIYDDFGRLLAEIEVNGGSQALHATYLWDGIGLAAEKRDGQVRYPVFDGLGTVQLWLDSEGDVLEAPRFDEWGNPQTAAMSPFGYTGRWGGFADNATGDILNWHRWYGPGQGNWLSRDPIGIEGGINLYRYADLNPVGYFDSDGLSTIKFDPNTNRITVRYFYKGRIHVISGFAANNTINPSGSPYERKNGPAPAGMWRVERIVQVGKGDGNGDGVEDLVQFGEWFIRLDIPFRTGIGIHAGRKNYLSRTLGCIRVNPNALDNLIKINNIDPLEWVTISPRRMDLKGDYDNHFLP